MPHSSMPEDRPRSAEASDGREALLRVGIPDGAGDRTIQRAAALEALTAPRVAVERVGGGASRGAPPDVLLVDLGDGAAAEPVAELRARLPGAPLVVLSDRGEAALHAAARRAGATAVYGPPAPSPVWLARCLALEAARATAEAEARALEEAAWKVRWQEGVLEAVRSVGHGVNNQLVTVLGNAELAEAELPPDAPVGELLREIGDAGRCSSRLVRSLAELIAREPEGPPELGRLVDEALRRLERRALGGAGPVHETLGPTTVEGDVRPLAGLVTGLLADALDRSRRLGESLRIRTRSGDGRVLLELRPAPERLDPAAARLLRRLGGVGGIESGGERLVLHLPARMRRPAAEDGDAAGPLVLLVDGDAGVRRIAGAMLQRAGFEPLAAHDLATARAQLARHGPRVQAAVLDGSSSQDGGGALLAGLRELCPDLPVVLCGDAPWSGGPEPERPRVAFARKPYRWRDLQAKLSEASGS